MPYPELLGLLCFFLLVSLLHFLLVRLCERLAVLECQLVRLENRLESRLKLPEVDTSKLDTKHMTLDELEAEAARLGVLVIPPQHTSQNIYNENVANSNPNTF